MQKRQQNKTFSEKFKSFPVEPSVKTRRKLNNTKLKTGEDEVESSNGNESRVAPSRWGFRREGRFS